MANACAVRDYAIRQGRGKMSTCTGAHFDLRGCEQEPVPASHSAVEGNSFGWRPAAAAGVGEGT